MDLESTIKMQQPNISVSWVEKIHSAIPDVKVYGSVPNVPEIRVDGEFPLSDEQKKVAESRHFKFNDQHATVDTEPTLLGTGRTVFRAKTLSFAELSVLRDSGQHGFILSACVVMICNEARHLVVHHRAPKPHSTTYPDCLHTIGGAFDPVNDELGFIDTAIREVREETRALVMAEDMPPIALFLEIPTRFMQVVFLGANISIIQFNKLRENWEAAGLVKVPFDDLPELLTQPIVRKRSDGSEQLIDWVPAGKAHIFAWLALGAPGARGTTFKGLSATDLFDQLTQV